MVRWACARFILDFGKLLSVFFHCVGMASFSQSITGGILSKLPFSPFLHLQESVSSKLFVCLRLADCARARRTRCVERYLGCSERYPHPSRPPSPIISGTTCVRLNGLVQE